MLIGRSSPRRGAALSQGIAGVHVCWVRPIASSAPGAGDQRLGLVLARRRPGPYDILQRVELMPGPRPHPGGVPASEQVAGRPDPRLCQRAWATRSAAPRSGLEP